MDQGEPGGVNGAEGHVRPHVAVDQLRGALPDEFLIQVPLKSEFPYNTQPRTMSNFIHTATKSSPAGRAAQHLRGAEERNEDHEDRVGDGSLECFEQHRVQEPVVRLVAHLVHSRREFVLLCELEGLLVQIRAVQGTV